MEERRRHPRYQLDEEAFIVHSGNIGKIKNISRGGALCRCIGNPATTPKNCLLDILSVGDDFSFKLKKIPANIVTEHFSPAAACQNTLVRRCGLQFDGLTTEQSSMLDNFIAAHTSEQY